MSSRTHASEDALGAMGCRHLKHATGARVLIGGLGMGFTLRAALDVLPIDARVQVVDLVPAMVDWNRMHFGSLTQHAVDDPRASVTVGDVATAIATAQGAWDAVLLDVDNGPSAMTLPTNAQLYSLAGLKRLHRALRPGGWAAVWSAGEDPRFTTTLKAAGFEVRVEHVHEGPRGGRRHVLWLARRVDANEPCRTPRDPRSSPAKDHRRNR